MDWFNIWWESLSLLQQCFAMAAIPATVILILQTVLLLFGIGGHGADHGEVGHDFGADHDYDTAHDFSASHDFDTDHDYDAGHDFGTDHDADHAADYHDGAHHAAGVRLFTLRGIVAMFAVGGWLGVAMCDMGLPSPAAILVAAVGGIAALIIAALVIKYSLRLQESGNISIKNAVAHNATVYIPIPAARGGTGKITMTLQERFVELEAITDEKKTLATGTQVQVIAVSGEDQVIVRTLVE